MIRDAVFIEAKPGAGAARVTRVIRGLLAVAKLAMPDTYYETDRCIRAAKQLLEEIARGAKR